jgi:hypothetical protein
MSERHSDCFGIADYLHNVLWGMLTRRGDPPEHMCPRGFGEEELWLPPL